MCEGSQGVPGQGAATEADGPADARRGAPGAGEEGAHVWQRQQHVSLSRCAAGGGRVTDGTEGRTSRTAIATHGNSGTRPAPAPCLHTWLHGPAPGAGRSRPPAARVWAARAAVAAAPWAPACWPSRPGRPRWVAAGGRRHRCRRRRAGCWRRGGRRCRRSLARTHVAHRLPRGPGAWGRAAGAMLRAPSLFSCRAGQEAAITSQTLQGPPQGSGEAETPMSASAKGQPARLARWLNGNSVWWSLLWL